MKNPSTRAKRGKYFKQWEWPEEISRVAIRQHDLRDPATLWFVTMVFRWRAVAQRLLELYRTECKKIGRRYRRDDGIDLAHQLVAQFVNVRRDAVANWLNRSRPARAQKRSRRK